MIVLAFWDILGLPLIKGASVIHSNRRECVIAKYDHKERQENLVKE